MAQTIVQTTSGQGTSSPLVVTLPATPTVGNRLVALAAANANPTSITGWTSVVRASTGNSGQETRIFTRIVQAGDGASVSMAATGATLLDLVVLELSGNDSGAADVVAHTDDTSPQGTTRSTGTTAATTQADAIGIGVVVTIAANGGVVSVSNGYAAHAASTNRLTAITKTLSATGAQESTVTWTTQRRAGGAIAVFKAATGGAGALAGTIAAQSSLSGALGMHWPRDPADPLIMPGTPAYPGGPAMIVLSDPCVLQDQAGTWHAWFSASYEPTPGDSYLGIKHATSSDGSTWTVDSGLALEHSASGAWDDRNIETPFVVYDPSDSLAPFRLYYGGGSNSDLIFGFAVAYKLGLATSTDGATFTRLPAASSPYGVDGLILEAPEAFPSYPTTANGALADPTLIKDGATWRLWFTGFAVDGAGAGLTAGICYATSSDGLTFTSVADPLAISRPAGGVPQQPSVIGDGSGGYVMWLTCDTDAEKATLSGSIDTLGAWRGTSADGVTWTMDWSARDLVPDLTDPAEDHGMATGVCAMRDTDGDVWLYYGGNGTAALPEGWEAFGLTSLYGIDRVAREHAPVALAGTISGQSGVVGTLGAAVTLSGLIATQSTLAGTMQTAVPLAGTIATTSTVAGALGSTVPLAGAIGGASTVAGALGAVVPLVGAIASTSGAAGALTITAATGLVGTIAATSSVAGVLRAIVPLAGSITGTSTAAGVLTAAVSLQGTAAATSAVAGTLNAAVPLSGSVAAHSGATADLTVTAASGLEGLVAATSTLSGTLTATVPLSGQIAAASTVAGALGVIVPLAGAISAQSGATGTVERTRSLSGRVDATSTTSGAVSVGRGLAGALSATSGAAATLAATVPLMGTIAASSSVLGTAHRILALGGRIDGISSLTATATVFHTVVVRPPVAATFADGASTAAMDDARTTATLGPSRTGVS